MTWDRLLWGVEFSSPREKPLIIWTAWMRPQTQARYSGEPTRPILFCTRAKAREWCKAKMSEYAIPDKPRTAERPVQVQFLFRRRVAAKCPSGFHASHFKRYNAKVKN